MSAIFGAMRFDGDEVRARDLERMANAMARRGPDGSKFAANGPAGVGHCLMRLNREDAFEAQPLYDREADVYLVAACRIDNREELAAAFGLSAADIRDLPDSALVLRAYKRWGENLAGHLLGDFSFAVWDRRRKTLLLGRDHIGQRPLYYHLGKGFFAFATDIRALWAYPGVPRELLADQIAQDLLLDVRTDPGRTEFKGIRGLLGAEMLSLTMDGVPRLSRYWEAHADPAHERRSDDYYVDAYRVVLKEAVECRLRRLTTRAGLFMSGGFDSAAICALAGPSVSAQGRKLIAVTSVPGDPSASPPRKWVEICARHMPYLDVRYVTRGDRNVFSDLKGGFVATGRRHSPNRHLNDLMYAEIARSGARLMMDGHGGDYTLNARGQGALGLFLLRGDLIGFLSEFRAVNRFREERWMQTFHREVVGGLTPTIVRNVRRRHRAEMPWFGPMAPVSESIRRGRGLTARQRFERGTWTRAEQRRLFRNLQNNTEIAGGSAAAAHGLAFTQPFHDKRVVELGLAIPERLYVKGGRTRYLAREALKADYPLEFQDRKPGGDGAGAEFVGMARKVEEQVLSELSRLEESGRFAPYFDLSRARELAAGNATSDFAREVGAAQAMRVLLAALYMEWFWQTNN